MRFLTVDLLSPSTFTLAVQCLKAIWAVDPKLKSRRVKVGEFEAEI
ncbi:MAG: hypothetical protein QXI36_05770 [Candidatus Bathyarchaeia archaeon]